MAVHSLPETEGDARPWLYTVCLAETATLTVDWTQVNLVPHKNIKKGEGVGRTLERPGYTPAINK